jgi:hypothetical protein
MFIGDGGRIQSTWLRRSSQLYRSAGYNDGKAESVIWQSALFGALLAEIAFTEEDDSHALVASQVTAAVIAFTEEDDIHALVAVATPVAEIAFTEEDDTHALVAISGFAATIAFTEEDDTHALDAVSTGVVVDVGTIAAPGAPLGPSVIETDFTTTPIDLDLGTIPAPPLPTGPHSIVIEGAVDDTAPLTFAHLYDTDGTTLISTLPEQFALSWQDVDSEPGAGRVSLPMVGWDDGTGEPYETDWAELTPGRILRCYLYGDEAFSWQIERPPVSNPIDENEENGMVVTASGRGWTAVDLDSAVIYPGWTDADGNPLNNPLNPSQRAYTFASDDFPRYDQWPAVESVIPYTYLNPQRYQLVEVVTIVEDGPDTTQTSSAPAPLGYPVTTANWIWPTADTTIVGKAYMRRMFGIGPGPRQVSITATADNYYTLYLNGTPIFGEIEDSGGWREFKTISLVLPAGLHTLAAVVENIPWDAGPNPAGFLAAVYEVDGDGQASTVWCQTDEFWTGIAYPAQTPGFTPGEIIFNMVYSAQLRGQLLDFSFDFNAGYDSAGQPWPYVPGIAFNVGDHILDALNELHRQHWVDYRFKPGSRTLQMFNPDSGRVASGAVFTNAVDIRSLNIEEAEAPCNRLLVKWSRGYLPLNDAASQAAFGKIFEETLVVDTDDASEATRRGEAEFAARADPKAAAILSIEPMVVADRPYSSFGVRDTVVAPYTNLTPTVLPVVSISAFHDEEGNPNISLELNRRARIVERDELDLLRQLGSGIRGTLESSDSLVTIRAVSLVD